MYTPEQLNIVSSNKKQDAYRVLRKDQKSVEEASKKYGVEPTLITELDSNIDPKEEFFDYPIIDPLTFKQMQNESK
jgi:hypothetical protein